MNNDWHLPDSPCFLGPWQWVGVFLCVGIKMAEIYTKTYTSILLLNQHYCITPCTLAGVKCAWINISCRCVQISSTNSRVIHLNGSLNGVLSVTLITCSVEWVQPSLLGSKEKMWYSARKDWVESASLGGQDSNPLKSSSLKNFSCLCFTVILGIWRPWVLSNASITPVCIGGSGTHMAVTALTMGVFFLKIWGYPILFLTTTGTFLLPLCNSVYYPVLLGPEIRAHPQHVGPESSHWSPL